MILYTCSRKQITSFRLRTSPRGNRTLYNLNENKTFKFGYKNFSGVFSGYEGSYP